MAIDPTDYRHPLTRAVQTVQAALDEAAGVEATFLSPEAKRDTLVGLGAAIDRLEAIRLRVMADADDVAYLDGSRDVGAWLTANTRTEAGTNHHLLALAADLDQRWHTVATALGDGRVNLAQAKVIVRALNALDPGVGREWIELAETKLVEFARQLGPKQLRRCGDRILEMIAPQIHEEAERRKLEAEQRRARAETRLDFRNRGDGSVDIHARIPEATAARLKTYLESFSSPRHDSSPAGEALTDPATGKRLSADRVRGIAFCAFLESADPTRMPLHGGDATTCVVTIPLKDLQTGAGVATLGEDVTITPGEFRRLACTAGILPAVLGTESEVLDLGRSNRFFKRAQRKAMAIEHPTCRGEGCTVPAAWCEAHHFDQPWSQGGKTDLHDGKLLCPWHHHCAHDETYQVQLLPNGDVRFHKRR